MTHAWNWIAGFVLAGVVAGCVGTGATQTASQRPSQATASEAPGGSSGPTPASLTVLCTPQEDWCQAMTKAFQDQTGIATSFVRLSSGEALAKVRAT